MDFLNSFFFVIFDKKVMRLILLLIFSHFYFVVFSQKYQTELKDVSNQEISVVDFSELQHAVFQCPECLNDPGISLVEIRRKLAPNFPDEDLDSFDNEFQSWRETYPKEFSDYISFLREKLMKHQKIINESK